MNDNQLLSIISAILMKGISQDYPNTREQVMDKSIEQAKVLIKKVQQS